MDIIKVDDTNMPESISAAVRCLTEGGIVAFPTESSYGLGARFDDEAALLRLHEIKGRPGGKAMPLIVADEGALGLLTDDIRTIERALFERFWPGPLTVLFNAAPGLSEYITESGTVAVRMPGHPVAHALAAALGAPLTATSANPTGAEPALTARDVKQYFGDGVDVVLDGGPAPGGAPSTIVQAEGGKVRLIRSGSVGFDELEGFLRNGGFL